MQYEAKDLFQCQSELVEAKVDMAVSKAIDRVLDRIDSLKKDIKDVQTDMDTRFSALDAKVASIDHRLVAVETKLGMSNESQSLIRAKFIEYSFKTGWIFLVLVAAFMATLLLKHLPILS